jgi:polyhydroxyalkanoate synthesis regulator protein
MNYTIKYYKNRKLYSTDAGRYVNLSECKALIDAGHTVKFIEHGSDKDVTEKCLKEMIKLINVGEANLIDLIKRKV